MPLAGRAESSSAAAAARPDVAFPEGAGSSVPYAPQQSREPAPPIDRSTAGPTFAPSIGKTLAAGAIATAAFTAMMYAARATRMNRLDLPMLLGTFVARPGARARTIGMVPHLAVSVAAMPLAYRAAWRMFGLRPTPATGALLSMGLLLDSAVAMYAVGKLNPRATEAHVSEDVAERGGRVKAPGFAARRYGWFAPASMVAGHAVYGAILGWWMGRRDRDDRLMKSDELL
jgi:hypothetical protein